MTWDRCHHFVVSSCFGKLYGDCDSVLLADFTVPDCVPIHLSACFSYLVIHLDQIPGAITQNTSLCYICATSTVYLNAPDV